jgi:hypothetical protein
MSLFCLEQDLRSPFQLAPGAIIVTNKEVQVPLFCYIWTSTCMQKQHIRTLTHHTDRCYCTNLRYWTVPKHLNGSFLNLCGYYISLPGCIVLSFFPFAGHYICNMQLRKDYLSLLLITETYLLTCKMQRIWFKCFEYWRVIPSKEQFRHDRLRA